MVSIFDFASNIWPKTILPYNPFPLYQPFYHYEKRLAVGSVNYIYAGAFNQI
ncbi:MAG: hypothetical protein IPK08_16240 [Bacteroidetes bacterium]|nr:hypothetical protein [Bacteroidota bacterium]